MNDHPIKALGHMLQQSARPIQDEHIRDWRRATFPPFASLGVFNINSLDPNDARGVEDVIDFDRERAKRDGELIETNSADPGDDRWKA